MRWEHRSSPFGELCVVEDVRRLELLFWFSDRATFQSLFNLRDLRILQIVDLPYQPGLRALFVPPECHRPTAIHYKELTVRVARVHNRVFCIPDIRYGSTISSSDHYCVCLFRCTLSLSARSSATNETGVWQGSVLGSTQSFACAPRLLSF